MSNAKLIDISRGFLAAPLYPDSPAPKMTLISQRQKADECNETVLTASLHTSTHADAPCHFTDSTAGIDQMALDYYLGPCHVVSASSTIDAPWVHRHLPDGCRRLLIKGGGAIYAAAEAAEALAEKGVITIGTDAWSVGPLDNEAAVHGAFLSRGIAILENLDLSAAGDGRYFLSALPIKVEKADGAFVRAVLVKNPAEIL